MIENALQKIGFVCAYTPLPLIHAAGYVPLRVLPMSQVPDQAGHLLHDNLCPHVKRILDRALGQDLPELAAMVFINSCDAMRRLADAWQTARRRTTPSVRCSGRPRWRAEPGGGAGLG